MTTPVLGANHVDDVLFAIDGTNFNGLGGTDTLVFAGSFYDYSIQLQNMANLKATITNESGAVTDSKQIEYFRFDNGTYNVAAGTFVPSLPSISVSDASVVEGGQLHFVISLSAVSATDVTGQMSTAAGTATGMGVDYNGFQLTNFTIPAGQQSIDVYVQTKYDNVTDPNETMALLVSNVTGATVADNKGVGTISDYTGTTISVSDASVVEGGQLHFVISLSAVSATDVTGQMNTATTGAASGFGGDFFGFPPTNFTIPAGQQSIDVFVQTTNDNLVEPNETMSLFISNVTGAGIVDNQGVGTIIDLPPVSPTNVSFYADPAGATEDFPFNVTVEGQDVVFHFHRDMTETALDVHYTVGTNFGDSPTPGVDFILDGTTFSETTPGSNEWIASNPVHFDAGESDVYLVFHAVSDDVEEPFGEAFTVNFDFANNDPSLVQFDSLTSEELYMDAGGVNPTQVNIAQIHDLLV